MKVSFSVPGEPRGKGRPRFGRGHTYTPAGTRAYEEEVGWAAKQAGALPLELPVALIVRAYFSIHTKKQKPLYPCLKRPDLDNCIKILMDGCNGIAWKDDAQVYSITAEKRYSQEPRVEVEVWYADTN